MKIHLNTDRPYAVVYNALQTARAAGTVAPSVDFDKAVPAGSRSHASAIDVHLVSEVKEAGVKRHRPQGGGPDWAATYDEWGFFLAEIFRADPTAKATYYASAADFHAKTSNAYA